MATTNPFSQSEIDRYNRYLKRYTTMSNPTAADKATYNQIKSQFGNFNQQGLIDYSALGSQQQRNYRAANPYADITKQTEMRFLNDITDMQRGKQGVSDAQMKQYNELAGKWNFQKYDPYKDAMDKATQPIDFDKYRTESATIEDLAKKYGFDYSRDYAKRQAEAEAQARRDAIADANRKNSTNKEENLKAIDNNLMNMADGLDRQYFLQGLNQAQGQVESGLNGGIAADQNLRMAMARQADMGAAYRDANLGRMTENNRFTNEDLRLAEQLGLVNQEALVREDTLFNDRLNQAFDQIQQENKFNQSENQLALETAFRNQDKAYQNARDTRRDAEWESEQKYARWWEQQKFNNMSAYEKAQLAQQRYQFDNMSADQKANFKLAQDRLAEEKRQFNNEDSWRKHTYNNMSAEARARLDADIEMFGKETAWKKYELEYSSNIQLQIAQAGAGQSPVQGPSAYTGGGLTRNFLTP